MKNQRSCLATIKLAFFTHTSEKTVVSRKIMPKSSSFFCCKRCAHYIFAILLLSFTESVCKTRKNVFYFTSKALFIFEQIKVQNFRDSIFITLLNASNKKYNLLNNLGSRHSLLMKFGQNMSYYKRKKFIKNSTKTAN